MRPKSVLMIVAIAVLCLLGFARGAYLAFQVFQPHTNMGRTLIACQGKDEDAALRGCSEVIDSGGVGLGSAKGKNLVYAYNRRSVIFIHRKQFDPAIEDSGHAIRLDPGASVAYYNRANAFVWKKNDASALLDFDKSIELNPGYAPAWLDRGTIYERREDYARAIVEFDQALRLAPSDGFAYIFRGLARSATGDLAGGLDDCNRGIGLRPKDDFAFDCRGFTYLRMKQYSRALPDYNVALEGHPKNAGWLYCRGAVKRGLGDQAGFKADRAAAFSIDPAIAQRYKRFGID